MTTNSAQSSVRVPILCYHRIVPDGDEESLWTLGAREFERQLQKLADEGWESITLDEFRQWQEGRGLLPARPVILTFDDGQEGFCERVASVLLRHHFRATLFLIAGFLGQRADLRGGPAFRIMSGEEAAALAELGIDVQSHGLHHLDWREADEETVRREVLESAAAVEEITGRTVKYLAYPYGGWNRRVRDLVQSLGFAAACTTVPGRNARDCDPFLLRRELVLNRRGSQLLPWAVFRGRQMAAQILKPKRFPKRQSGDGAVESKRRA